MRLLNCLLCEALGHEPSYFQAWVKVDGRWGWHNLARCAHCGSANSLEIHTPGFLDLPAWFYLGADALRFSLTEWHRGERRAFLCLFRKRQNEGP